LVVEAYAGNIVQCDPKIVNISPDLYAVIAIEVIEHLYPDVLHGFEKTVFGLLHPPLVLITTPNSEFNPVFNLGPGEFRHDDHKFEWTRFQFACWCRKICSSYPGYKFEISGIGKGAEGTEHLGCVSQLAIFTRDVSQPHIPTNEDLSGMLRNKLSSPYFSPVLVVI